MTGNGIARGGGGWWIVVAEQTDSRRSPESGTNKNCSRGCKNGAQLAPTVINLHCWASRLRAGGREGEYKGDGGGISGCTDV